MLVCVDTPDVCLYIHKQDIHTSQFWKGLHAAFANSNYDQ